MIVVFPDFFNMTFKADFNSTFFTGHEPDITAGKPVVGKLCLPAVNKLLLEDTVFVKD